MSLEHCGKCGEHYHAEMEPLHAKCADFAAARERIAELEAENARLRFELRQVKQCLSDSRWSCDCDHKRHSCEEIGCNGKYFRLAEEIIDAALEDKP